jgi:hypothetical protein
MLDLFVLLMKIRFLLPFVLLLIASQDSPPVAITSPTAGEDLRGQITIAGSMSVPDFISAQLDFAYASNPADTWFTIQTFSQPAPDSTLAVWDTTLISDGDYIIRLRVNLDDGTFQEATIPVSVKNDIPLPTSTPIPTSIPEETMEVQIPTPFLLAASPTPTAPPHPTPTVLPANPAELNASDIFYSLERGALVIIGLFVISGLILRIRQP